MLSNTCILVNLRIHMPPQTKLARAASDDVEVKYQTEKKQGKVTKNLFHQRDIKPLTQVMSKARTLFNEISLPYDSAYRIIPSSSYFDFVEKMSEVSREFDQAKQEFLRNYPGIMSKARLALGGLFDGDDYPTETKLQNTVHLAIESSVVPAVTAFDELAGLTPEMIEELKQQAIAGQEEKVKLAMADLLGRLHRSLNKAKSKLSDEEGIFRDTLVSNIHSALTAVDNLNLTGDPQIAELATAVREVIDGIRPDDLRNDKELRAKTVEETSQLLGKMSEFF